MNNLQNRSGLWMNNEFEKGLVSVIIPTYNRAHILPEALDSVWMQTYRPIEILVVDDGSMDDTETIVESWIREHQGDDHFALRYFHQENAGAPSARNLGLIQSRGEYILFLDSDDVLYPCMVDEAVQPLENSHYDFVHVGYDKICGECGRKIYSYVPELEQNALLAYLHGKLWGHTTCIVRQRNLIRVIGPWDESLAIDQDGDYMVRTILKSSNMAVVRKRLFAYRIQKGTKINDKKGSQEAWQCRLQRETQFCEGLKGKEDIPSGAKGSYAQRLYMTAVYLNAERMTDIGDAFGELAEDMRNVDLNQRGKMVRRIWKGGKHICVAYQVARRIKQGIKVSKLGAHKQSVCLTCSG